MLRYTKIQMKSAVIVLKTVKIHLLKRYYDENGTNSKLHVKCLFPVF